ncbi:MAG: hypothetical protein MUF16_06150 [Burkholderiaceae bacterium]|nr:hypothetical protein [Burkholderiaceae bacterium]
MQEESRANGPPLVVVAMRAACGGCGDEPVAVSQATADGASATQDARLTGGRFSTAEFRSPCEELVALGSRNLVDAILAMPTETGP